MSRSTEKSTESQTSKNTNSKGSSEKVSQPPSQTDVKKSKKSSGKPLTVNNFNFSVYVMKVLKQIHPNTGISGSALATMVNLVKVDVAKLVSVLNQLMIRSGAKTLKERDVIAAIRIALPGELAKQAVSEANKAVTKYTSNAEKGTKQKPVPRAVRAGIVFNVTRVENLMMLQTSAFRKGVTASVALATVVEYLTSEVLELAGNAAASFKKVRITPRHIKLSILGDEELNCFYRDTIISGGISPYIHQSLLPQPSESVKKPSKPKVAEVKSKASGGKQKPKVTKAKPEKAAAKPKVTAAKGKKPAAPKADVETKKPTARGKKAATTAKPKKPVVKKTNKKMVKKPTQKPGST